jgi:ATP-dependent RNA helicase DDX51/DBP6
MVSSEFSNLGRCELRIIDLIPIPQPSPAPEPEYNPTFLALPSWLAKPVVVESNITTSFADLNLDSKLEENLKRKGYEKSLAVQAAVIPLLSSGPKFYNGDICISAATGSGKTLAYILPMVEQLRRKVLTRLRGLVVVPTRELVAQAREVAETCAAGTSLQIGVAIGNVSLAEEQDRLVKKSQRYDPVAWEKMCNDAKARLGVDFCEDVQLHEDLVKLLPDHVPDFSSKVDILICTPGRLVDHIRNTRGFSLRDVEYLVIDEADRLLDESFQEWVTTLLNALHSKKFEDQMIARQRVLGVDYPGERRVRKVILSATMTRDLSKLASLRLRRPILISVVDHKDHNAEDLATIQETTAKNCTENFELPSTLIESAIPVGDGIEKPLYMLQLLNKKLSLSKVLVFTSNNENAGRLGHLLPMLDSSLDGNIGILTKTSSSSKSSRKTLKAFRNGKLSILIASDRASRGLDVPDVAHVVNYDMPHSMTSYVHRVGRTARAGREGMAWTLFTNTEARWFWNEIARSSNIGRGSRKVERIKVDVDSIGQGMRRMYENALKKLQFAVQGDK